MKLRHGRLIVDVPSEWSDRSQLMFVAPPQKVASAPLSVKTAQTFQPNLSIAMIDRPDGVTTPQQYLEQVDAELRSRGAPFDVRDAQPAKLGSLDGWRSSRALELMGVRLLQTTLCAIDSDLLIIASVTMAESSDRRQVAEMMSVLDKLELASLTT